MADFWYGIRSEGAGILRIGEIHVDPCSVGDLWFVRGSDRDLVVEAGSGIVPPAPLIAALSGKPVLAGALNSCYDRPGARKVLVHLLRCATGPVSGHCRFTAEPAVPPEAPFRILREEHMEDLQLLAGTTADDGRCCR